MASRQAESYSSRESSRCGLRRRAGRPLARHRLGLGFLLLLVIPSGFGCTQNLNATASADAAGGSSAACAGLECAGDWQCCSNLTCKSGHCAAASDAGYYAGPGQPCAGATACVSFYGVNYTCESVEDTRLCLSTSGVKNGKPCLLSTDCTSLRCEEETGLCQPGAACVISGKPCTSDANCCTNQCGLDGTCMNSDKACQVLGDACTPSPGGSDCCAGNACSKVGNTYRCVNTTACRGPHDACGQVTCCQGVAACDKNRCVEPVSCSQRGTPCSLPSDCCSNSCALGADRTASCVALDGCQPFQEKCTDDWECCSGNCDARNHRCSASTQCAEEGDICSNQRLCCPEKAMACIPDATGVTRCSSKGPCLENKSACFFGKQCCADSLCRYDAPSSTFVCNSQCQPLDQYCSSQADCCSNYCSPYGRCAHAWEY